MNYNLKKSFLLIRALLIKITFCLQTYNIISNQKMILLGFLKFSTIKKNLNINLDLLFIFYIFHLFHMSHLLL